MSKIYEVRSIARGDGKTLSWGAHYTRDEAELALSGRSTGANKNWADKYHLSWWIEEIDTTGMFVIPPKPRPRDRYSTRIREITSPRGGWNTLDVDVLDEAQRVVATYKRNYPNLYQTFEPFRQGDRAFALISTHYTATSVLDLGTGETIAVEEPHPGGFCPVGFYVPDWWDVNDGRTLPGSSHWDGDQEKPSGDFGFVWGCIWGDDFSWKVQYLDLTQVQQGKILRDDRFGYVELATNSKLAPSDFIRCWFDQGECTVTFATLNRYDVRSGKRQPNELE